MRIALVLVFIALPLMELAVLIKVGQLIGFWWTMLILAGTAIGGGLIVHEQGFGVLRRAAESTQAGRLPLEPVIDGVFLMLAGALLLTPGLITDAIGGVLLVPALRRALARWAFRRALAGADVKVETPTSAGPRPGTDRTSPGGQGPASEGIIIDGEWEQVDDPTIGSGRKDGTKGPRNDGGKSS